MQPLVIECGKQRMRWKSGLCGGLDAYLHFQKQCQFLRSPNRRRSISVAMPFSGLCLVIVTFPLLIVDLFNASSGRDCDGGGLVYVWLVPAYDCVPICVRSCDRRKCGPGRGGGLALRRLNADPWWLSRV